MHIVNYMQILIGF